jgi:hypothetical protein
MPIVGANAILLCSDDGNNVRAAQRWARANEVWSAAKMFPAAACAGRVTHAQVRLLVDSKETRGATRCGGRVDGCCRHGA